MSLVRIQQLLAGVLMKRIELSLNSFNCAVGSVYFSFNVGRNIRSAPLLVARSNKKQEREIQLQVDNFS